MIPEWKNLYAAAIVALACGLSAAKADEPPAINPFGPKTTQREDAIPGCIELSDGSVHPGMICLTRDKRLGIYDKQLQRQREIPLRAVKRIDCKIKREWMEKEWKFKETTSDEKIYTGRGYPAREYLHTITLHDGRTIAGPLSALVYLQPKRYSPDGKPSAERYLLNKRDKGKIGEELKSLVYVKRIKFGKEAMEGAAK